MPLDTLDVSRFTQAHVAPLGLRCWVVRCFYKHVAPLGLKNLSIDLSVR